eukprot:6197484-Pleurochrysis_carterae.AAC.1
MLEPRRCAWAIEENERTGACEASNSRASWPTACTLQTKGACALLDCAPSFACVRHRMHVPSRILPACTRKAYVLPFERPGIASEREGLHNARNMLASVRGCKCTPCACIRGQGGAMRLGARGACRRKKCRLTQDRATACLKHRLHKYGTCLAVVEACVRESFS